MVYIPILTITLENGILIESSDLTKPASAFIGKPAFLVLKKDTRTYVISIAKPFLFEKGLNRTQPIGTVFQSLLSDLFVTRYATDDIPLKNAKGTYNRRLRVYSPLSYKTCTVKFTSMDTPQIEDDITKKGYLDDLVITSPEPLDNTLAAVNGVFHRTTLFQDKLYIHDGFRTMRLTGRKDVVLVDSGSIGGHTVVPLTTSNTTLAGYDQAAVIDAGMDLTGKTVLLVVDGYLYHKDSKVFHFANSNKLKVDTRKLSLIEQFRHNPRTILRQDRYGQDAPQNTRKYSDAYEAVFLGKRQVPSATFKTKEFQLSRLAHYHSFLIVLNKPGIFQINMEALPMGTPQYYIDPAKRILSGVLDYGVGLCPSYLLDRDPFHRTAIFIPEQDYDVDWQNRAYDPPFIPVPTKSVAEALNIRARFVDYVSN